MFRLFTAAIIRKDMILQNSEREVSPLSLFLACLMVAEVNCRNM
jgi:hypothetical protein